MDFKYRKVGCRQKEDEVVLIITKHSIRSNKIIFQQGRISLKIKKTFLVTGIGKQWNRLLGQTVESPSLEDVMNNLGKHTLLFGLLQVIFQGRREGTDVMLPVFPWFCDVVQIYIKRPDNVQSIII